MREGDDATLVANVIQGTLKLSASTGDGREQIVGVAYPSDFIGRPFGRTTPHSVTALADARLRGARSMALPGSIRNWAIACSSIRWTDLDRPRTWMLLPGRSSLIDASTDIPVKTSTPAFDRGQHSQHPPIQVR
jgi:CRP/FNR family transcriptional regulator